MAVVHNMYNRHYVIKR